MYCYPHFTVEETEAQGCCVIIPARELEFGPEQFGSRGCLFIHRSILHPEISAPHLPPKVIASAIPVSEFSIRDQWGKAKSTPSTAELSSRSQQAPAWTPTPQPGGQLWNGSLHIIGKWARPRPVLAASEEGASLAPGGGLPAHHFRVHASGCKQELTLAQNSPQVG